MKDWNEYIGKIYNHTILVIKSYKKKTNERNRQYFLCKCLRCGNFFETSDHSYITQYMRKHNLTKTTKGELFKILKAR